MTGESRRDFIKKLAAGAAYTAPVVLTMSAPRDLAGQGMSSEHHTGGGDGTGKGKNLSAPSTIGPPAPGTSPSPGTAPTN